MLQVKGTPPKWEGGFVYDGFMKGERPLVGLGWVGLGFSDHLKGWSVKRGLIK